MNLLNEVKKKLYLGILQYQIKTGKIHENINTIINNTTKDCCDILILPEMGITGFNFKNLEKDLENADHYLKILSEISSNYNINICTTLPYRENKSVYNRLFFITPEKNIFWYDKHYLINWGGFQEKNYVNEGNSFLVINLHGWLIGFGICYDIRFPELFYHMNKYAYEKFRDFLKLILIPAQWPSRRIEHLVLLSKARAIENLSYLATTNCIGKTKDLEFNGKSLIVDPDGKSLLELNDESGLFVKEIDFDFVHQIKKDRPILNDRYKYD